MKNILYRTLCVQRASQSFHTLHMAQTKTKIGVIRLAQPQKMQQTNVSFFPVKLS